MPTPEKKRAVEPDKWIEEKKRGRRTKRAQMGRTESNLGRPVLILDGM